MNGFIYLFLLVKMNRLNFLNFRRLGLWNHRRHFHRRFYFHRRRMTGVPVCFEVLPFFDNYYWLALRHFFFQQVRHNCAFWFSSPL